MIENIKNANSVVGYEITVAEQKSHYDFKSNKYVNYNRKVTVLDHPREEDGMDPGSLRRKDYIKSGDKLKVLSLYMHRRRKYLKVERDGKDAYIHTSNLRHFNQIIPEEGIVDYRQKAFYPVTIHDKPAAGNITVSYKDLLAIVKSKYKKTLGWVGKIDFLTESSNMLKLHFVDAELIVYEYRFQLFNFVVGLENGFQSEVRIDILTRFRKDDFNFDPVDIVRQREIWNA